MLKLGNVLVFLLKFRFLGVLAECMSLPLVIVGHVFDRTCFLSFVCVGLNIQLLLYAVWRSKILKLNIYCL